MSIIRFEHSVSVIQGTFNDEMNSVWMVDTDAEALTVASGTIPRDSGPDAHSFEGDFVLVKSTNVMYLLRAFGRLHRL